jgi:GTP-binding protein
MFIDTATILVRGGKGGAGVVAFRREKYVPKGGPSGGDGGDGGSVVLVADVGVDTLLDFAGRKHWYAPDGQPGQGKQMHGRDGDDVRVAMPAGTLVYDDASSELLGDLDEVGKELIIARGGNGGFGNEHFKTATQQTPRQCTPGNPPDPPEARAIRLELKLIADVGLIGKPNAGKSTFLAAVSKARPKIADYPFTTLEPNLGIVDLQGYRRIVIADIPGLIEGASQGQGLGTKFLRHVERTHVLVHLLEIDPTDGSNPITNYHAIRAELAAHSSALADKPQIVAISKIDLMPDLADRSAAVELIEAELGVKPFTISAATHEGLEPLLETCWRRLKK